MTSNVRPDDSMEATRAAGSPARPRARGAAHRAKDAASRARAGAHGPREAAIAGHPTKTLSLPRLNGLTPTLESTALKLMEEAGELAEAIGKFRALSGERLPARRSFYDAIGLELLDVAQTAVTMMFVLEDQGVDVQSVVRQHIEKLERRGYLTAPPLAVDGQLEVEQAAAAPRAGAGPAVGEATAE